MISKRFMERVLKKMEPQGSPREALVEFNKYGKKKAPSSQPRKPSDWEGQDITNLKLGDIVTIPPKEVLLDRGYKAVSQSRNLIKDLVVGSATKQASFSVVPPDWCGKQVKIILVATGENPRVKLEYQNKTWFVAVEDLV